MENFYVVFDATDPTSNRIGLSYNVKRAMEENSIGASWVAGIALVVSFFALVIITIVCICVKKRREERLNKAKTYFETLRDDEDGESQERQLEDDENSVEEADNSPSVNNPNHFLKSTEASASEQLNEELL